MIDDDDLLDGPISDNQEHIEEIPLNENIEVSKEQDDFISNLLKRVGIEDKNNILYEEDGNMVPKTWDDLDLEDKLNIVTYHEDPETGLDDSEIQLINTIRNSNMTPEDYIKYISESSVKKYLENSNSEYTPTSSVDDLEDDVLFVSDIIQKVGEENVTDDELKEILDNAKANPTLYKKQVEAIRKEYKQLEESDKQSQIEYQRQVQLENYNRYAEAIENSIRSFNRFGDIDIEMSEDEMENLYNYLIALDDTGNSKFSRVMQNPDNVVKLAWLALNGDQMLREINDQYSKQLSKIKNEKKDTSNNKQTSSLYINNNRKSQDMSDYLDA